MMTKAILGLLVLSPLAAQSEPQLQTWTLGELRTPTVRIGTRSVNARPFARLGAYYTQETRGGQPNRVREGLSMEVELGASGRYYGWRRELAGVEFSAGGYNAQWDGDFFLPIAIAESGVDLRLGGVTLLELRADQELAFGKVLQKKIGAKRKRYKLGPARIVVRSKIYAAMGSKIGGTVFLSKPGELPGSDLGLGLAIVNQAGAGAVGRIRSGRRHMRCGGTARLGMLDARYDYTVGVRQSGVDAQVRLKLEALAMRMRVWVKLWFYKAKRTLLSWRMAGFELRADSAQ